MDGCVWHVGTPGGPTQTLAAWVMPKREWQVGAEITMGSAPPWPLLTSVHFGSFWKHKHAYTHTHTRARAHTRVHLFMHLHTDTPLGFPLIC